MTNRKRQDIMKSQTKKNNLSKISEINLTRNLKKEVQSDGIESKCTKYKSRKYIEEQKCMKWSTVQWRSERLIGKKEKQIRIIRRSQINVFQVS